MYTDNKGWEYWRLIEAEKHRLVGLTKRVSKACALAIFFETFDAAVALNRIAVCTVYSTPTSAGFLSIEAARGNFWAAGVYGL